VMRWEELIDFIAKNCGPKEPHCLTAWFKCNLTQEELDEEYLKLYALGYLMNDPLYGLISYTIPFQMPSSWNWDTMCNYYW
jgi:hypothetical protein